MEINNKAGILSVKEFLEINLLTSSSITNNENLSSEFEIYNAIHWALCEIVTCQQYKILELQLTIT